MPQRQVVAHVEVVLVILWPAKLLDIRPDAIPPDLAGPLETKILDKLRFIRLVDNGGIDGAEVEFQRAGKVPLQVVTPLPGKALVEESVKARVHSGEAVAGGLESAVHNRAEAEGIWQGIEIEFRNQLQVLALEVFKWLDSFGWHGVEIIQRADMALFFIKLDDGGSVGRFSKRIAGAEVGDAPGHGQPAAAAAILAHVGQVVTLDDGHLLRLSAQRVPFSVIICQPDFVFEPDIQIVRVKLRSAGHVGILGVERQAQPPGFGEKFVEVEIGRQVKATDLFALPFLHFLVNSTKADRADIASQSDAAKICQLRINPPSSSSTAPFIKAGQAHFINPYLRIVGHVVEIIVVAYAHHDDLDRANSRIATYLHPMGNPILDEVFDVLGI